VLSCTFKNCEDLPYHQDCLEKVGPDSRQHASLHMLQLTTPLAHMHGDQRTWETLHQQRESVMQQQQQQQAWRCRSRDGPAVCLLPDVKSVHAPCAPPPSTAEATRCQPSSLCCAAYLCARACMMRPDTCVPVLR
jgi:hypothetical protein